VDIKQILKKLSTREHNSLKARVIIITFSLFIIYLVISFIQLNNSWGIQQNPWIWQASTDVLSTVLALIATAIAVAWLSVAIEKETKETFLDLMRQTVTESLLLSDDSIAVLDEKQKKRAIKLITHNLLGKNNESVALDFIMDNLERTALGWRSDVVYETKLEINPHKIEPKLKFKLCQRFSYTQNYDTSHPPKQRHIKIGFAFNNKILDQWLKEDDWFFREVLFDKIDKKDNTSLLEFIHTKLEFKLLLGKDENTAHEVSIDAELVNNEGIVIRCSLPETNQFFFKVCFCNNRPDRHFLITFPILIKSARIMLLFDDSKFKVDGYEFLTRNSNIEPLHENYKGICKFEMKDQWLFPVSGIMFVWEEITPHKAFKEVSQ